MGCDIHMMVERKKKNRKTWVHETGIVYGGRNYPLFALLAGVRSYSGAQPVFTLTGIPVDASSRFKEHCRSYGNDGHSHGSLTLDQYRSVLKEYGRRYPNDDVGDKYNNFLWEMEDIVTEGHQARICFFFDN